MKKRIIFGLLAMFTVLGVLPAHGELTAEQVAQKVAATLNTNTGLKLSYTIAANGRQLKGSLKSQGNKFAIATPQLSTWYNGKDLYTYNLKTQETTVVKPSAQELLEANPLLYVKSAGSGYSCKFSPVKRNGRYVVDLVPRTRKGSLQKLTVTVNSSTFRPERVVVTNQGSTLTVDVTNFTAGVSLPAAEFEYPKAKYPGVEIVDLR